MDSPSILAELPRYGPEWTAEEGCSLPEAEAYCRRLARSHYENFTVASWLLPRELRAHFYHIYAYCRWADDLADETGDPQRSLTLLDWWEEQLELCYRGRAKHPVFVALSGTIEQFAIPPEPFRDLLRAFRRDQRPERYATFGELLEYCRGSANPVGRLVLYLGRCFRQETAVLADSICTGLQLANFWQDVASDHARGRVYLPEEDCLRFGYDAEQLASRRATPAFRELLGFQVARAEELLQKGRPLLSLVPRAIAIDVDLFIGGGRAVLRAIRGQDFDVWTRRPVVGRWTKLRLLLGAWWRRKPEAPVGQGDSR